MQIPDIESIASRIGSNERRKTKKEKLKQEVVDIQQINYSGVNAYGKNIANLLKSKADHVSQYSIDSDHILVPNLDGKI